MSDTTKRYRRELSFWSLHCGITALPSFLIAGLFLEYFDSATQTLAMLPSIVLFICSYAALTTFAPSFQNPRHLLSRALKGALRIRIGVFILALALIPFGEHAWPVIFLLPDLWAGFGGASALAWLNTQLNLSQTTNPASYGPALIFLWTLLQGLILTFLLSLMTFGDLLILNLSQRNRWRGSKAHPAPSSNLDEAPLISPRQ